MVRYFGGFLLIYGLSVFTVTVLIQLLGNPSGSSIPIALWTFLYPINYLLIGPSQDGNLYSVLYAVLLIVLGLVMITIIPKWKSKHF